MLNSTTNEKLSIVLKGNIVHHKVTAAFFFLLTSLEDPHLPVVSTLNMNPALGDPGVSLGSHKSWKQEEEKKENRHSATP